MKLGGLIGIAALGLIAAYFLSKKNGDGVSVVIDSVPVYNPTKPLSGQTVGDVVYGSTWLPGEEEYVESLYQSGYLTPSGEIAYDVVSKEDIQNQAVARLVESHPNEYEVRETATGYQYIGYK